MLSYAVIPQGDQSTVREISALYCRDLSIPYSFLEQGMHPKRPVSADFNTFDRLIENW